MKKVLALILALVMCLSLFAGCGKEEPAAPAEPASPAEPAAPAEPADPAGYEYPEMTIVINDYNVEGSGPAIATKEAAAYIEEKSGGKIKCDLYIGGTMMEAADAFAGTAEGLADITFYLYSLNSGVAPLHELFGCFYYREMPDMVGMHTVINNTIDAVPAFREEFMKSNL